MTPEKTPIECVSQNKSFGGMQKHYSHWSTSLNCQMRFAIFLPPQANSRSPVPVLYWLSGLTCTDENFMHKAGAQRVAAELGIAIVAPDTSPRGDNIPDDPQGAYDLGLGAGFYLNATQPPWAAHYRMEEYIVSELPALVEAAFPISQQRAISGHSMGGHGAITLALKNPHLFTSVSAFSPICNPLQCPWGNKALSAYLGNDQTQWRAYDSSELMKKSLPLQHLPTLVDQGLSDNFLEEQLRPEALEEAAKISHYPLTLRRHQGYDHSYYFIASFIEEHLRFHGKYFFNQNN